MKYAWEFWTAEKLIAKGTSELTEKEMLEIFGHTNGYKLLYEWNRMADIQHELLKHRDNMPAIKWKYYML